MPIVAQFLARDLQGRSLQEFITKLTETATFNCQKYGHVYVHFEPDPIIGLKIQIVADSSTVVAKKDNKPFEFSYDY